MNKKFSYIFRLLFVGLLLGGSVALSYFRPPSALPPQNNAEGPLESSTNPQHKGTDSTIPSGSLLNISNIDHDAVLSGDYLFVWNNAIVNGHATVVSLAGTGVAHVCSDAGHKLVRCAPSGAVCGNTVLESGEQCDDGNIANGDGCSSTCQNEPPSVCGNTVIESGEQCDDGNIANGDGCSSTCQSEAPIQNYTHTDNLGAVMGICHLMPDPYAGQPGYLKATRDAATEANATARGVTKVEYTFRIRTDNSPNPQTSVFTATFFPGDLEYDFNINQINHDAGGYCSAVACDSGYCPDSVQEYF